MGAGTSNSFNKVSFVTHCMAIIDDWGFDEEFVWYVLSSECVKIADVSEICFESYISALYGYWKNEVEKK